MARPLRHDGNREASSWLMRFGALVFACFLVRTPLLAADAFGGSVSLTSDYLVRGVTRSDHDPALQLDLHYLTSIGLFAGLFVSNARIDANDSIDAEVSGYFGYAWTGSDDWHARALYSHYAYPWNAHGSGYDYDEVSAQLSYQGWVQLSASYTPNYWRYNPREQELYSVAQESAEVNLQHPVFKKFSLIGGLGYAYIGGRYPGGYVYYSAGGAYDIGPFSLALSYVNTDERAKRLFYKAAADNRVIGTVIWRF